MIVLDTHAWIWWIDAPDRLSRPAHTAIERAEEIGVSAMSSWEIALLDLKGRILLPDGAARWVERALSTPRTVELVVDSRIAFEAVALEVDAFPADPADRMIYATARVHGSTLVTRDKAIRDFDPRGTLW